MTLRRIDRLSFFRILAGAAALSPLAAAPALAGFEWVPPAQVMNTPTAPTVSPAATPDEFVPMNAPDANSFNPAPGPYAGAEMLPSPVAPMTPPAANSGELVINPYPMGQPGYGDVLMGVGPVEQAMMAESRQLNPLQLGYGMNTGSKARAMAPTYPAAQAPAQTPTNILPARQGMGGMSSMPGGPLEPLPGYAAAPVQQAAITAPSPVLREPIINQPPIMAAKPIAMPPMAPEPAVYTPPPAAPVPSLAMKAPPKQIEQPPVTQPVIPASATTAASAYPEAVGFGNDLPLALALSQVIPGDYALFFETKVDAEKTNVSWQGGKPWDQVLQEMLAPLGLRAVIQPNLVMIRGA